MFAYKSNSNDNLYRTTTQKKYQSIFIKNIGLFIEYLNRKYSFHNFFLSITILHNEVKIVNSFISIMEAESFLFNDMLVAFFIILCF